MVGAMCEVNAEAVSWKDRLLGTLDALPSADAAGTAVVVAETLSERGMHEAGRVARLHPGIPVFVLTSEGAGTSGAIFDLLHPFQRALLVDGQLPEDTWTRVARHWHECYRLSHPPGPGNPRTLTSRPWAGLDDFIRQDNILQLRSIMTEVVARGRRWVPGRAVVPGSFIELSEPDLEAIAAGRAHPLVPATAGGRLVRGRAPTKGSAAAAAGQPPRTAPLVNSRVVPWADLPAHERRRGDRVPPVTAQPARGGGFHAGGAPGRPPGGGRIPAHRDGPGQAAARPAARGPAGPVRSCTATPGTGGSSTAPVTSGPSGTRSSARAMSRWAVSSGCAPARYRAWRVSQTLVLRTMEGRAIAQPGDWVVEGAVANGGR